MSKLLTLLLPIVIGIKNPIIRNALIAIVVIGTGILICMHPSLLAM
ncbi:TPA: hypothetical protein ACNU17_003059 [Aeromonas salmonicida subsp. pectinolytica]